LIKKRYFAKKREEAEELKEIMKQLKENENEEIHENSLINSDILERQKKKKMQVT